MGRCVADRGSPEVLSEDAQARPSLGQRLVGYFTGQDPTFWIAFTPALIASALLYVRSPASNYIFDEQEALLANPYVNGTSPTIWAAIKAAFRCDFWGLPPDRSIGSYRPIPDLIWRALWHVSQIPWLHHWVNVVFHAVNAALVAGITLAITKRRDTAWLAGLAFVTCAVLTEAVTGVVGIADVLGGLGVLLAITALRWPIWAMPLGVFAATTFGMFSKESAMVAIPIVAWVALVAAPMLHPGKPRRVASALLALVASASALVLYTYLRRRWFPVHLPASVTAALPPGASLPHRAMHAFLVWFQQPVLPHDPINNPLVEADFPHRVAGALRVYWRGVMQVVFPWHLSGDYSFPQEPIPARVVFPASVLGGLLLVGPPIVAVGAWIRALVLEKRGRDAAPVALLAIGLLWAPIAYFPHSNIPVLLPTVRAERFWYLPAMGTALLVALLFTRLFERVKWRHGAPALAFALVFFGFQAARARMHALDYTDDLSFWNSTRQAVPNSAKAQLNYSVMVGARGRMAERLVYSRRALDLAPQWPMAHIYLGDTLCRMHRAEEAWPHYKRGFEMAPNDPNLIALALQCMWDEHDVHPHDEALLALAREHPGSWIAYLGTDIVDNGDKFNGVDPKYRPRGYNEGPKK